jgi:tetratricopeptide (TPR) repeat protein
MAKIGRNDRCPCGSGKKYKKCCLAGDEAAARAARAARPAQPPAVPARGALLASYVQEHDELDELTEASNAVVDMVQAGNLDAAEQAAHDLLARFPDVHDGYDRLGMICEARGDRRQAADYYRRAINVIRNHPDNYDPAFEGVFQRLIDRLEPAESMGAPPSASGHVGNTLDRPHG